MKIFDKIIGGLLGSIALGAAVHASYLEKYADSALMTLAALVVLFPRPRHPSDFEDSEETRG